MAKTVTRIAHLPKLQQRKRVAAYARVSSGKDAMLHSLSAQVSYYNNLIQSNGQWEFAGVYSDEAITGTKEERPGFQHMLEDCRNGKIDLILPKSISRLARNTVTLLETVRRLKALGVDIFFEEQNIHSMSADGELMMTILASYAQEESRSASENQKWRIRQSFQKGELANFRFMFGYRIKNGIVSIEPSEAAIVQEIYRRVIDGESFSSIGRDVESRKIPRVFGGKWNSIRIRELVSNEKYTGNSLLQKRFINNHLEKKQVENMGELPMYYVESSHPAIVGMDTFEKAQAVLNAMDAKAQGKRKPMTSALTGKIVCCRCGRHFKRVNSNGTVGWNCSTYQSKGKAACQSKKIPDATLKAVTAEVLNLDEYSDEAFNALIDHIEVPGANQLRFYFRDGTIAEQTWKDKSRRDSWTEEMREKARQRANERNQSRWQNK